MASQTSARGEEPARVSWVNDPRTRGIILQVIVAAALIAFIYWIVGNTADNLRRANIASGFGFLNGRAGFDLGQSLIPYSSDSTFLRAIIVGLLNTLLIAVTGIVTATIVGFLVGVGRLSGNWLISAICTIYVEVFRNIPPLLVIFFWYVGVLAVLPGPRDSVELPLGGFINNRGFYMPKVVPEPGFWLVPAAFVVALIAAFVLAWWARRRQMATGQIFPVIRTALALIVGLPILAFLAMGSPATLDFPTLGGFSLTGGYYSFLGFDAIAVALLGRANPGGVLGAAFLFGVLRAGSTGMQAATSTPVDIIVVIQALIILFVAAPALVRSIYRIKAGRGTSQNFTTSWGG